MHQVGFLECSHVNAVNYFKYENQPIQSIKWRAQKNGTREHSYYKAKFMVKNRNNSVTTIHHYYLLLGDLINKVHQHF